VVAYLTLGTLAIMVFDWMGPSPTRIEFVTIPLYGIYAAIFVWEIGKIAKLYLRRYAFWHLETTKRVREFSAPVSGIFGLSPLLLLPIMLSGTIPATLDYPPAKTKIIDRLIYEVSVVNGKAFGGYVATFTGYIDLPNNEPAQWTTNVIAYDNQLRFPKWNGHRFVGLWYYDIPTLQEYSHFITPQTYCLRGFLVAQITFKFAV
jgi:hypothetical protein